MNERLIWCLFASLLFRLSFRCAFLGRKVFRLHIFKDFKPRLLATQQFEGNDAAKNKKENKKLYGNSFWCWRYYCRCVTVVWCDAHKKLKIDLMKQKTFMRPYISGNENSKPHNTMPTTATSEVAEMMMVWRSTQRTFRTDCRSCMRWCVLAFALSAGRLACDANYSMLIEFNFK